MSDFGLRRDVYLMLTEQCPCSCDYCYIQDRTNPYTMSMETVSEIMERDKPRRVIFFGGEPMLRPELIEAIMSKHHGQTKFQIITSGIVNFDKLMDLDAKYHFNEIQISYDGNGITSRKLKDGFANPLDNSLKLANRRRIDLKCVISEANIDRMFDIHLEFSRLREQNIQGEFVIAHVPSVSENFLHELEKNIKKCLSVDGKTYTEFLNKILAIKRKDINFSSCDAGHYIIYRPNGERHYCTILSQYEFIDSNELREVCYSEDCKKCKYKILCDGGCRYERYINFGKDWKNNHLESTCKITATYYNAITSWLDELSEDEHNRLNNTLLRYIEYQKQYSGG